MPVPRVSVLERVDCINVLYWFYNETSDGRICRHIVEQKFVSNYNSPRLFDLQELLLTCNVSSSLKESQDVQESFKHLESWYDDNVSMVDCLSDGPFWNFIGLSCTMLTRNAGTVLLFSS